jgi:hypothetical protein
MREIVDGVQRLHDLIERDDEIAAEIAAERNRRGGA